MISTMPAPTCLVRKGRHEDHLDDDHFGSHLSVFVTPRIRQGRKRFDVVEEIEQIQLLVMTIYDRMITSPLTVPVAAIL
jgi:hypothetical protein